MNYWLVVTAFAVTFFVALILGPFIQPWLRRL